MSFEAGDFWHLDGDPKLVNTARTTLAELVSGELGTRSEIWVRGIDEKRCVGGKKKREENNVDEERRRRS